MQILNIVLAVFCFCGTFGALLVPFWHTISPRVVSEIKGRNRIVQVVKYGGTVWTSPSIAVRTQQDGAVLPFYDYLVRTESADSIRIEPIGRDSIRVVLIRSQFVSRLHRDYQLVWFQDFDIRNPESEFDRGVVQ